MKASLIPLAIVVAALGGGLVGASAMSALEDDAPAVSTTTTTAAANRDVADETSSLAELYKDVAPSVVEIQTRSEALGPLGLQPTGTGTGWLYDSTHVVTNQHVVDDAQQVSVRFHDGTEVDARVVGTDQSTDVALLELDEAADAEPLRRGGTHTLEVGDPVVAIGSPFGLEGSLTAGVVSGLGRTIEAPDGYAIDDVVQTDAALNPGNSGGPLLTTDGAVVGMNAQIRSQSGSNSGVGYAIPIETVESVVEQLLAGREVRHPYLGVRLADVEDGAQVVEVVEGGPADDAGIRAGDVIVRVATSEVCSTNGGRRDVNDREPGDELELVIRRNGDEREVTVELGTRPRSD